MIYYAIMKMRINIIMHKGVNGMGCDLKAILRAVKAGVERHPYDATKYADWWNCIANMCKQTDRGKDNPDYRFAHAENRILLETAKDMLRRSRTVEQKGKFYDLYKRALKLDAVDRFDSFLLYLELDRPAAERFYQPRRKVLKKVVDALQKIADDELDELFLSMPPRVGKTTLCMFFALWIMGRDPELSNLYCSYSDIITATFYGGILEVIGDKITYHFNEIFPDCDVKATNAKDEYIDLRRRKKYHSMTARSLGGTLNGACDASGMIIADDLISGIEEALNKNRLISAWGKVSNNLLTRKSNDRVKVLWIGTRWSVCDPIGVRREMLENDEEFRSIRYEVIDLPAIDEHGKSNFNYDCGVGFGDLYYSMKRAEFERKDDIASWDAQYMQKPVERTGSLFEPDSLRYYNGELPAEQPDAVWSVTDPSYGGGDYVAKPILYIYGNDIFVHDVVFSNLDKKNTIPMCVQKIIQHHVTREQVEGTKSTESYADDLSAALKEANYSLAVTSKPASTKQAKQDKITNRAPDIKDNFIFRSSGNRSKEYQAFMEQVFAFKIIGKNVHDDAPDSLAMAADMIFGRQQECKVFKRFV